MTTQPIELSQENKRGSQSIQIGQQNNYYGMDYQNTKALCLDLIKNELNIYKDEAEKIARERDEHFLTTFFNQLHEEKLTMKLSLMSLKIQICSIHISRHKRRTFV